jgi:hypothetical protein
MQLPVIHKNNITEFLNEKILVQETAEQIMKDFGLFGLTITFSGNTPSAYNELFQQLKIQIETLVNSNYQKLLSVLYQVDITDKEIANTQAEIPEYSHIEIIAHQIIVRDLKKVLTRHYFKNVK